MQDLTDKTHVIITRGTGRHYISAKSAEQIASLINGHSDMPLVMVNDQRIAIRDIQGIVTASFLEELDHTRASNWRCKYSTWHARGDRCQCYLIKGLGGADPQR